MKIRSLPGPAFQEEGRMKTNIWALLHARFYARCPHMRLYLTATLWGCRDSERYSNLCKVTKLPGLVARISRSLAAFFDVPGQAPSVRCHTAELEQENNKLLGIDQVGAESRDITRSSQTSRRLKCESQCYDFGGAFMCRGQWTFIALLRGGYFHPHFIA